MSEFSKAAAIFNSPVQLRDALQALSQTGFEDVSLLIKQKESDDAAEVKAYSTEAAARTATYPDPGSEIIQQSVKAQTQKDEISEKDPNALNKASVVGGVLGVIAGLAALAIPGIGPVLATGTIASAIGVMAAGGAVGVTAGAIGGLLKDEGLPSDRVDIYREAFEMGKGIVVVDSKEDIDILRARDILNQFQPEYIDTF